MSKHRYLYAIIAFLLCILACSNPSKGESPKLAGPVEIEGSTPVPQVDAVEAIQTYAQVVLGLSLTDLTAGGSMGELNLPITTQDGKKVDFDIAGITYLGFWKGGIGSLSIGDSYVSGDWVADVEDGCLGAYVLLQDQGVPADPRLALNQILSTYPGLSGYEFVEAPIENFDVKGYSFVAKQVDDIQIQSWKATLTGTIIRTGIAPGMLEGRSATWVVVASGALATPFEQ